MAAAAPVCDFGRPAPDFALEGVDGRVWTLADVRGPKGTVVMFICNHCPYVTSAIGRIVRDAAALEAHGVRSVAIMPNDTDAYPADGFDRMKEFAAAHRFPFPYLIDRTQAVARAYDAVCTPDFFGYDAGLGLQYRGRLDAAKAAPVEGDTPRELFDAMVGVARTGHGPARQVPSMGCSIKWRPA